MTWYYIIIIYRIWRRGMPFSLTKRSPTPRPGHTMRLGTILLLSAVVYVMTCTTSIPSTRTYLVILLLLLLNIFVALDRAAHSFIITAVIIVITTAIIVDTAVPPPPDHPKTAVKTRSVVFERFATTVIIYVWIEMMTPTITMTVDVVEWRESRSRDDRLICDKLSQRLKLIIIMSRLERDNQPRRSLPYPRLVDSFQILFWLRFDPWPVMDENRSGKINVSSL